MGFSTGLYIYGEIFKKTDVHLMDYENKKNEEIYNIYVLNRNFYQDLNF
jgi:hypothetical protein